MTILNYHWHVVVKYDNCELLLTSSGQEYKYNIATDI